MASSLRKRMETGVPKLGGPFTDNSGGLIVVDTETKTKPEHSMRMIPQCATELRLPKHTRGS